MEYRWPDAMGGVSNTELNLTYFYTNHKFLLALLAESETMLKFWIIVLFDEIMG